MVNYYANHYSAKFGRRDIKIAPQAIDLLMVADWPGNVRQLCNEVQRVIARSEDGNSNYSRTVVAGIATDARACNARGHSRLDWRRRAIRPLFHCKT